MKERTLSILILFFAVIFLISCPLGYGNFGLGSEQKLVARYVCMISVSATTFLLMQKIISSFFLPGRDGMSLFHGMRLSAIEVLFVFYCIFLTREAREEWRAYINKKKSEVN